MGPDYLHSDDVSGHLPRRKMLMEKYGAEIKELARPNPWTSLAVIALVFIQFLTAFQLKSSSWWTIPLVAYFFGAFLNHALYVLIHECTHNCIFKTRVANKILGLICDFPLVVPSAMAFRKYHMYHHRNLGDYVYDPDVTPSKEAAFIGNSSWKKLIWITFFFVSQGLRPGKMKNVSLMNPWIAVNMVLSLAVSLATLAFFGPMSFLYLCLSTFFGLGLHPLGGRWIQEHYVTKKNQETYSYYGLLNWVTFNMGYHNEHHDLMHIPWNNLPKLKKLAPEFYLPLKSYSSWSKVLFDFIFDKRQSPYSRIVRNFQREKGKNHESHFPHCIEKRLEGHLRT